MERFRYLKLSKKSSNNSFQSRIMELDNELRHLCGFKHAFLLIISMLAWSVTSADIANELKERETVILQLKWKHQFQFAGYYAAIQKGYYREAGLDVILKEGGPDIDFVRELTEGDVQYAVSLPSMLVALDQGKPIVALAAIFQHSPEILLVLKESAINSPHDLIGKKIMMSPSDTPLLLAMLQNEGISQNQFTVVDYDFDLEKLVHGDVDAIGAYTTDEPLYFIHRQIPVMMLEPRSYGVDFYGDCLFTSEEEIRSHPERVSAFRKASLKGWRYAMTHIDEMIEIIQEIYHSDKSKDHLVYEAQAMKKLMFSDLIEIGHMNPGRWQYIADTYANLGIIKPGISLNRFLYNPNPEFNYSVVYWVLGVLITVIVIFGSIVMILLRYNRRLAATEAALRSSEKMLQMILDMIPVRVFWKDRNMVYLGCNGRFAEDAGLKNPKEIIGRTDNDLSWKEDIKKLQFANLDVIQSRRPRVNYEDSFTDARGNFRYLRMSIIPILDHRNDVIGILGVYDDITEMKRVEMEQSQLRERIQQAQKYESLSTLAGGVAHHFNNLLQAMMGNAELALYMESLGKSSEKHIKEILEIAKRATELSKQMLACSGSGTLFPEIINLSQIVQFLIPGLQTQIPENTQLISKLNPDLKGVRIDSSQLRQLLLNLITNAFESMGKEGGKITISTGSLFCSEAYLNEPYLTDNLAAGEYVYVEVSDTGIGMDQTVLDKVFDPFFSTKFTGRGLGMATVLGVVRGHKGAIKISSNPGVGTAVKILFRSVELPSGSEPVFMSAGMKHIKGKNLLIIDDEIDFLKLSKQILETIGFNVYTASTVERGLQVLENQDPELSCIILDMIMPEMNGDVALDEIRKISPTIPILIITGLRQEHAEAVFKGKSISGILQKPFEIQYLSQLLDKILS